MVDEVNPIPIIDDRSSPVVFADGISGVGWQAGVLRVNFAQFRYDSATNENYWKVAFTVNMPLAQLNEVLGYLTRIKAQIEGGQEVQPDAGGE